MSLEDCKMGPDMRLVGKKYCIDCSDPEACHQGTPCEIVRLAAEEAEDWTAMSVPETDEERLDRTNNFRIIDDSKGMFMAAAETAPEAETDYDQDAKPDEEYVDVQSTEHKLKILLASIPPERILGVLAWTMVGVFMMRRRTPKRTRVDHHYYMHAVKK